MMPSRVSLVARAFIESFMLSHFKRPIKAGVKFPMNSANKSGMEKAIL